MLAGPGVVRAGEIDGLHTFAAQSGAGVVNSWGAKGVFRWDDPHHFGTAGLQARDFELAGFADADLIVAAGVDLDETPPERWQLAAVLEVEPFQLAPLAYTWPPVDPPTEPPALYRELSRALAPAYESDALPITPARAAADLSRLLPDDGIVAADPGPAGLWIARAFPTTRPGSVVVPSTRAPGFAVAAAIAAALAGIPAVAVTTAPFDPTTVELLELAEAWSCDLVVAAWGGEADWGSDGATGHSRAIGTALREPGPTVVPVPVDLNWTRTLVEVAGEVVAWQPPSP